MIVPSNLRTLRWPGLLWRHRHCEGLSNVSSSQWRLLLSLFSRLRFLNQRMVSPILGTCCMTLSREFHQTNSLPIASNANITMGTYSCRTIATPTVQIQPDSLFFFFDYAMISNFVDTVSKLPLSRFAAVSLPAFLKPELRSHHDIDVMLRTIFTLDGLSDSTSGMWQVLEEGANGVGISGD